MVKAPEKFLDEYLSHQKGVAGKTIARASRAQPRSISDEELARLRKNIQTLWDIYNTQEIKDILSRKHKINFLDISSAKASLNLSYADKGILMEYELDLGNIKEIAGAKIYKQAEMTLNRYFTHADGIDKLLSAENTVLQAIVDNLIYSVISEPDIWNAIAKGERIKLSAMP